MLAKSPIIAAVAGITLAGCAQIDRVAVPVPATPQAPVIDSTPAPSGSADASDWVCDDAGICRPPS